MNQTTYVTGASRALVLVTVAVVALLVAQGAISLIALRLLPHETGALDFAGTLRAPPAGSAPPDACAILARNIFDSDIGALCPAQAKPVAIPWPPGLTQCGGEQRRLVAAVRSALHPEVSLAVVATASGKSLLVRQGERIGDDELFAVYTRSVLLKQSSGQLCSLTFAYDAVAPGMAQSGAASETRSAPTHLGDLDEGITTVSATEFRVRRFTVDAMLADHASLAHQIRIVPHEEDGRVVGAKVYGLRRGSPWQKLGLQNGDLLRAVDDRQLDGPEAALEVYGRLRTTRNLSVALERRDHPMTLSYVIE